MSEYPPYVVMMVKLDRQTALAVGFGLVAAATLSATPASAQTAIAPTVAVDFAAPQATSAIPASWHLGHPSSLFSGSPPSVQAGTATPPQAAPAPAPPFEYSDGYRTRLKIHKIASVATLPLFATQLFLGQSLYDDATADKKTAHIVIGSSIGALFGVNTVTGVWNLIEARKDPEGRGLRLTHGLLMLSADAGFVTTGLLAPDGEGNGNRTAHRAMAITSIAVATTGYLIMLFAGR